MRNKIFNKSATCRLGRLYIVLFCTLGSICNIAYAQEALPYPLDTIDGKIYYRYTVERSIGLYRVSKKFGVTQEDILEANPHLRNGLRFDDIIHIPIKQSEQTAESNRIINRDSIVVDSIVWNTDSIIRLAVMLPLHADALKRNKTMERFYDFYTGVLMAIHEVQACGQKIEVFVFDIGKTDVRINQLLNDSLFPAVDAIIGPAYRQQIDIAAKKAEKDSIWMLIPFLNEVEQVCNNPYLLQFNPSNKIESDTLAAYLAQYGDSINCVLVEASEDETIPQSISTLHQSIQSYHIPTSTTTITQILEDSLVNALVEGRENIIIFNTEKYSNLKMVMPYLLNARTSHNNLTLYSHYSWQNEKIILPQIYTTTFKCDYSVPESYSQLFKRYFTHTLTSILPRYDLLGYDQTKHLLQILQTNKMEQREQELWHIGIQSDIHYVKMPEGGYINQNVHILRK